MPLGLSYDDVLLIPQYSEVESRNNVDLFSQISPNITLDIPIISTNMTDVTGLEMAIELAKLGGLGVIPRFQSAEEQANLIEKVKKQNLLVGAAIGIRNGMYDRLETLIKAGADIFFLDVAHGHMKKVVEATRDIKTRFPKIKLISGNVATADGAEYLFKSGADGVKVGIGPGSICTTRITTGSGVPQITALLEVAAVARKYKKTFIADGGIKNSGDIVKALATGASAVMLGNMLAGTSESPGKKVKLEGKWYKVYNASTSVAEKINHVKRNGSEFEKHYVRQIEGIESVVPYKGSLKNVIESYTANMRSGFSYSGASNIKSLWKNAKFIQITAMGKHESGAHDVLVMPSQK
ncbi:MAG: IMP dehydrogenase [Patescibacteria group bacterium]